MTYGGPGNHSTVCFVASITTTGTIWPFGVRPIDPGLYVNPPHPAQNVCAHTARLPAAQKAAHLSILTGLRLLRYTVSQSNMVTNDDGDYEQAKRSSERQLVRGRVLPFLPIS